MPRNSDQPKTRKIESIIRFCHIFFTSKAKTAGGILRSRSHTAVFLEEYYAKKKHPPFFTCSNFFRPDYWLDCISRLLNRLFCFHIRSYLRQAVSQFPVCTQILMSGKLEKWQVIQVSAFCNSFCQSLRVVSLVKVSINIFLKVEK